MKIKAALKLNVDETFDYCIFHPIDGGLLFAAGSSGKLHLYDVASSIASRQAVKPTLSLDLMQK